VAESQNDGETRRRVNRVATLDQGVVVNDGGYADGDRTLEYSFKPVSKEHNASIERMVRLYSSVNVATPDGYYTATPDFFSPGADENTLTLLVTDKLA
jgi:hypothetical protein